MKTIISAIIFSKDSETIKSEANEIVCEPVYGDYEELHFDIACYNDSSNIDEKLSSNRGFDSIITIGDINDFPELFTLPPFIRLKWVHLDKYSKVDIARAIIATFRRNINFKLHDTPLFSFFTCAYRTSKEMANRLYESLKNQTYGNWDWWIVDDSPENYDSYFRKIKDPRIHIVKNVTTHGNIGYNKHIAAMIADGDYLVEVDHDDEITPDCLEMLKKAFEKFNCDFAYSYCFEEVDGASVYYADGFALGLGKKEEMEINGVNMVIPTTPDVNVLSMRHIVAMPNHIRAWRKDFYHKISGHNTELSVMDDTELIIRTFLNGTMCKIPKVLYIQHEGTSTESRRGSTTQAERYKEIWRTGRIVKEKYDKMIHEYALSKGIPDPYWDEEYQTSYIFEGVKEGTINLNYILE